MHKTNASTSSASVLCIFSIISHFHLLS